jgi:hypothetical protein
LPARCATMINSSRIDGVVALLIARFSSRRVRLISRWLRMALKRRDTATILSTFDASPPERSSTQRVDRAARQGVDRAARSHARVGLGCLAKPPIAQDEPGTLQIRFNPDSFDVAFEAD